MVFIFFSLYLWLHAQIDDGSAVATEDPYIHTNTITTRSHHSHTTIFSNHYIHLFTELFTTLEIALTLSQHSYIHTHTHAQVLFRFVTALAHSRVWHWPQRPFRLRQQKKKFSSYKINCFTMKWYGLGVTEWIVDEERWQKLQFFILLNTIICVEFTITMRKRYSLFVWSLDFLTKFKFTPIFLLKW